MVTYSMTQKARIYNGEKTVSSTNSAEKTGSYMQNNEIKTFSTLNKNKLKQVKDLNVRLDNIIFLDKNIGRMLFDTNSSSALGGPSLKAMKTKAKTNKWDLTKPPKLNKKLHNKGNHGQNTKTIPNGRKYLQMT